MNILEKLKTDQLNARKAKDENLVNLLTTLYSEALNVGKNQNNRLSTDDEVIAVIKKFIKNNEQNVEIYTKANKVEALKLAQYELSVLTTYLPKAVSAEDIKVSVTKIMADNNLPKEQRSMGVIMKELKVMYGNSLDGALASKVIKECL